jgi:L-2-hydroxyglutarate oxidase LhgO
LSERVDCVVIGAGIVGLAVGRALAEAGRDVVVLERNDRIGEETSARNSEVIHAGIHYATGSLKARLCVDGKRQLYQYCEQKRIPHRRCGKLIVAADGAPPSRLEHIASQAEANGVIDLEWLDAGALAHREPSVRGSAALWSPSTGIVDVHALVQALAGDIEAAGGVIATGSEVQGVEVVTDAIRLEVRSHGDASELDAATVINAAGLSAGRLAANARGAEGNTLPSIRFAKGNYFLYEGHCPFTALVYPLPVDGGLGIHATFDLAGRLRFGPDVEWVERIDYAVDGRRRGAFAEAIRSYWPALDETRLVPGYAGIRPKLVGPGEPPADFRIDLAARGTRRQLVHLLGIESPGLTSALAIADHVAERVAMAAGHAS